MNTKRPFFVITGSTGVGKSDTVSYIAQHMPVEIVNVDIGSFYEPFSIGTAKPDLSTLPCRYHFFNILHTPVSWNVDAFRKAAHHVCQEIWERGNIPLFVGGSVFYIKNLLFDYSGIPEADPSVQQTFEGWDTQALYAYLFVHDQIRAKAIGKNDHYRLVRACSLHAQTGKKPSEFGPVYNPLSDCFRILWLDRPRRQLYERINARTKVMLDQGWIVEVEPYLHTEWETLLAGRKLIGYDVIVSYLRNEIQDMQEVEKRIAQATRNYAKRQATFLRMLQKKLEDVWLQQHNKASMHYVDLTLSDHSLYIMQSLQNLE